MKTSSLFLWVRTRNLWNHNFSLQKYINRCDLHMMKALRKNFFLWKRAFHHLNWQLVLKRAVRYAKWASCKIQYLKLLNRMMEWRTGGSAEWWNILRCRKMEYPKMLNTFFYLTKALKWNCNKRIDYLHLTGNIKRSIGNHYCSPEDKGIMRLWN